MIEQVFVDELNRLGLDEHQRALVNDTITLCLAANAEHRAPGELAEAMIAGSRARARLDANTAVATAAFASSADWAADGARSAGTWLATYTETTVAAGNGVVATARRLLETPHVLAAHLAGDLGWPKVRLLLAVRTREVLAAWTAAERTLVQAVTSMTVSAANLHLARWQIEANETGAGDKFKEHRDANTFRLRPILDGRHVLDGELDAVTSSEVQGAMDAVIKGWHADGDLVDDTRTLPQLQAAALAELIRCGTAGHNPARPSAMVLIDADTLIARAAPADGSDPNMPRTSDLLGGGPLPPEVIRRLCCNADITRVVRRGTSEVLDVGRAQRLATPAIRKAVWARSGGLCEVCHHQRLAWCQIHHLDPWQRGGDTSVENSLLVCSHCHHLLHEGRYRVKPTDHGWQLIRPDGTFPRMPLRHEPPQPPPPWPGG